MLNAGPQTVQVLSVQQNARLGSAIATAVVPAGAVGLALVGA